MLFGQEHVDRYRETGGKEGHDWNGTQTLILTTTGRRTGKLREAPLIYGRSGEDYLVVASMGGAPGHPSGTSTWRPNPETEIQVWDKRLKTRARTATPEEKPAMWKEMTSHWPDYDSYQEKTDREIPVVVLEPV